MPSAVLGAGLLGAWAGMLFGCGVFYLFFYESSSDDYRDIVLVSIAQAMGVLGLLLSGTLAAIPRAGVAQAFVGILVAMCIVALLCASANLDVGEAPPLLMVAISGLVPAAAVGLLARKIVDRSVARAEPSPGTAASSQGS